MELQLTLILNYVGSNVGILVGFQLSGFLAASKGGWPSVFYATGGLGCVWVLLWIWIGASTPAEHATITTVERDFIETSLMHVSKNEHVIFLFNNIHSKYDKKIKFEMI